MSVPFTVLIFCGAKARLADVESVASTERAGSLAIVCIGREAISLGSCVESTDLELYRNRAQTENNYWPIAQEMLDDWNERTGFYKKVMCEGFSLWWFVRSGILRWLRSLLADVDAVDLLLKEQQPVRVYIVGLEPNWSAKIQVVCDAYGVEVAAIEGAGPAQSRWHKIWPWLHKRLLYRRGGLLWTLRALQGWQRLRQWRRRPSGRPAVVLITHSLSWFGTRKLHTGKSIRFDTQLGLVLDGLDDRDTNVLAIDVMTLNNPATGWRTWREKRYPYVPAETLELLWLLKEGHSDWRKVTTKVGAKWQMSESVAFAGFEHHGIELGMFLQSHIHNYLRRGFPRAVAEINRWQFALREVGINEGDVVVLTDENGSGRPLVAAAKLEHVPVVGVQHAAIHRYHPNYIYPQTVERDTIPICDVTALFGEYYKRLLVNRSVYPPEKLVVTGQSRLDLYPVSEPLDRATFLERLGFSADSRLVVYTSTSRSVPRKVAAELIFAGLASIPNVSVVVKSHPVEKLDGFYERVASQYGLTQVHVSRDLDLYGVLQHADVLIATMSTTVSEGIIFGNPVILLDAPGAFDCLDWVDKGLAVEVGNSEELDVAVLGLLDGDSMKGFKQKRIDFIADHYSSLDGKATQRIVDVILGAVNRNIGTTGELSI